MHFQAGQSRLRERATIVTTILGKSWRRRLIELHVWHENWKRRKTSDAEKEAALAVERVTIETKIHQHKWRFENEQRESEYAMLPIIQSI
jgi:hypothetical protein